MAILAFQKPDKVIMLESDNFQGKFEFRPLEPGYGITIGNALRRILLSSLEGFAITSIKIDGVDHEFSAIPGVIEDVTNIILNLKMLVFTTFLLMRFMELWAKQVCLKKLRPMRQIVRIQLQKQVQI